MGLRGPKTKPTELKLLQGVPGGTGHLPKNEVKPEKTKSAKPPRYLTAAAKKIWRQECPKLEALGLMTEIDLDSFAAYCDCFARWLDVCQKINKRGWYYAIYETGGGVEVERKIKFLQMFPESHLYNALQKTLYQYRREFGLTPSSRAGIGYGPKSSQQSPLKKKLYGG